MQNTKLHFVITYRFRFAEKAGIFRIMAIVYFIYIYIFFFFCGSFARAEQVNACIIYAGDFGEWNKVEGFVNYERTQSEIPSFHRYAFVDPR